MSSNKNRGDDDEYDDDDDDEDEMTQDPEEYEDEHGDESEDDEDDEDEDEYTEDGEGDGDESEESDESLEKPDDDTDVDPRGQPAEYYQPEYEPDQETGEQTFEDEHLTKDERKEEATNRGRIFACFLCCCCLICIIIALILLFVVFDVFKKDDAESPSNSSPSAPQAAPIVNFPTVAPQPLPPSALPPPTLFPTLSPAPSVPPVADPTGSPTKYPTAMPTLTPEPTQSVPDDLELIPVEDTYIVDGFDAAERHGEMDSFLVQNGPDHINEIPDSFALLQFSLEEVPFARIQNRVNTAILELTHEPSVLDRGAASYTIERLPSTRMDVESLHLGIFPLPENGVGAIVFNVDPSDETVSVNITELVFGGIYEPEDDDQLLLLIANYGPDQDAGDRFKTREVEGSEPKIRMQFYRIPGVPDSTAPPKASPTLSPSDLLGGNETLSPTDFDDDTGGNNTDTTE